MRDKIRGLFSKYTIFFLIIISLYIAGDWWTKDLAYSQPNENKVTIAKPGIIKFDWTSGNLDYKGINVNADAADGDTDWIIYKFTWSGSNPTIIQERQGSWTLRASYF